MTSAFLFTTWSMKPGSWWEKPLWSWLHTCEVSRYLCELIWRRHSMSLLPFSHLSCCLNFLSSFFFIASLLLLCPFRPFFSYPSFHPFFFFSFCFFFFVFFLFFFFF